LTQLAVKLLLDTLRQVALMPFSVSGRAATRYFQPGVPWVAFLVLVFWCLLEATIFTATLLPAVAKTLANLSGADDLSTSTRPALWILLVLLSMGSFACIQAFTDALKTRERKFLVQLVLVEFFVMTFEVMFLYRPLVDAITPWLGQPAGDRFRPAVAVALGTFGWVGVRGLTWFLFGRYGTPSLLAFISRQPLVGTAVTGAGGAGRSEPSLWRLSVDDFMREIAGLHERGDQLLEYLALPAIHVIAVAVNFAMVLIASRPVFSLPFRGIRDARRRRQCPRPRTAPRRNRRVGLRARRHRTSARSRAGRHPGDAPTSHPDSGRSGRALADPRVPLTSAGPLQARAPGPRR
jgi:hypothetical protein